MARAVLFAAGMTRPRFALLTALTFASLACGGADPDGDPAGGASILGDNAATYVEVAESTNSSAASSEVTGYTLDLDGLRIQGTFEPSGPTWDYYRFDTGTFTRVDVQVFVDGVMQNQQNAEVWNSLNAYVDDGYSTLSGQGYFVNAWLSGNGTNKAYVLGIGGPAGKPYVIEMKGR